MPEPHLDNSYLPSLVTRDCVLIVELGPVVGCLVVDCTDIVNAEGPDVEVVKPASPSEFSRRPTWNIMVRKMFVLKQEFGT